MTDSHSESGWFEKPASIRIMIFALLGFCAVLTVAEFFYTHHHAHFDIETSFAFQAWLGFVAFVVIVFLGKGLRLIIERPEGYYGDSDEDLAVTEADHAQ